MSEMKVSSEKNILDPNSLTFEERQKELEKLDKLEEEKREREKKSPFKNFIQLNKDYSKELDWLMKKSPIAYRIYMFLINNMDNYNAVMCSYKVLEDYFEVSTDTVRRSIKILKDKGYIAIFKSGTSNIYAVNDNIVWNSWGKNLQYSKFPANVIINIDEQEEQKKQIKIEKNKEVKIKNDN